VVKSRTGGQILVDQLIIQGVDHLFCVPGESYLAVLDALYDAQIEVTVCRQEGGAAMMAEAAGKLTGRPGICFVTRGPGAANATAGIHVAGQDSTPMILFIGQVERGARGREAFQEVDYASMFGAMVKWVVEADRADRLPEIVSRAFHTATAGRPGPVVVALPEDVLTEEAAVADSLPFETPDIYPGPGQMAKFRQLLSAAERPVAILGGSRWTPAAVEQFKGFARTFDLPVVCSFRRQMLFDHEQPCYGGDLSLSANPKLVEAIKQSDLVLLVGGRLSEIPSQNYSLLDIPNPRQNLVHVHPDAAELGRVYRPRLPINATPAALAAALQDLQAPDHIAWSGRTEQIHRDYLAWSNLDALSVPGALTMTEVMRTLREVLPADTIFTNGAGNFAVWLHRFWRHRFFGTQLAPTSGSMGYGIPAAVAAKRLMPDRLVIAFSGDGDFLMSGQEFATAVQYGLPIVVVLVDNGMYGTIRMHQERTYPGRVSGTDLKNPDFAAYARAFGGHGERIEKDGEFKPALQRALASGKPAILHCIIDPEAITPSRTLTALRQAAQAQS
jgi:acetolactate synthase-1/2/3 large subunit